VSGTGPIPGGEEVLCRKLALALLRDAAVKRAQRGRAATSDELWDGVLSGRSQLVDSFKRGKYRYFVVLPEADATETITALDSRSEELLRVVARGVRPAVLDSC
jgi:hypothetical protein